MLSYHLMASGNGIYITVIILQRIGIAATDLSWVIAFLAISNFVFILSGFILLICLRNRHFFENFRLQFIECAGVLTLTTFIVVGIGIAGYENAGLIAFYCYMGVPIGLTLLIARAQIWRSLLSAKEQYLSIQQKAADEIITEGSIRPILYLRAFMDDGLKIGKSLKLLDLLMGVPRPSRRLEELVARRGFIWRPVVALGNPHIPLNLHGVLKKSVSDTDWQEEVAYWHDRSAYMIMIANKTENIGWEIELIRNTKRDDFCIYVVTSVTRTREFFDHYQIVDDETEVPPRSLVVFRDPEEGWTALTSRIRSETAYLAALDIAFARTEMKLQMTARS